MKARQAHSETEHTGTDFIRKRKLYVPIASVIETALDEDEGETLNIRASGAGEVCMAFTRAYCQWKRFNLKDANTYIHILNMLDTLISVELNC